ncbi:Nucleotide-binding universal stress protein, UspA family [Jannaschia faecimaris]|uniref:Nucleotide-binding universal stress protein, UspA family n=1 Tax=Jannaschia faecimaris TaxID=1244108 RepID=A0A1H3S930_9RHOB|nr:universal stress protein [Jannaschia faecimaris]SDZ34118.1 Nucleotide-binding universal stress protein, UspA family [Jannaschia faecimaris]
MIGKILLAVDGSQHAHRATGIAAELAGKLNAELIISHVLMHGRPADELVRMAEVEHLVEEAHTLVSPGMPYIRGAHQELLSGDSSDPRTARIITALGEQLIARAKTSCAAHGVKTIKSSIRAGDYADEILKDASDFNVDMIIIGSRGLGVIRSTVLGSVSQKVLHHSECTVTVVR